MPTKRKFHGHRSKAAFSLMGAVTCQRAYYYCGRCGKGVLPWDDQVGLTARSFTPAAERLVSLAGGLSDSFAEAAERVLPEMAGLHLAETTVQRTSEGVGQRIGVLRRRGCTFGLARPWHWYADAHGRTCAYISLDLTGVRQQAQDGRAAQGRMPYVAMVYNPVPEVPEGCPYQPPAKAVMQARYLSGLYDLDELGLQLRKQAGQVGMDRAEVWIGLTDGGNGLEEFVRKHFPREPVLILDFWHAADHLTQLAKLLYPSDEEQRQALVTQWCHLMKHEGGQRIVDELRGYPLPRHKAVKEKHAEVVNYFGMLFFHGLVTRQRVAARFVYDTLAALVLHQVAPLCHRRLALLLVAGVQQFGQLRQMIGRMPRSKISTGSRGKCLTDELLQAVAAVGQANPDLGSVHTNLARLLAQLQAQLVQSVPDPTDNVLA